MYFSSMTAARTARAPPAGARDIPAYFLYGEPSRLADARTLHVETIAARSALLDWKIRPHRHGDLQQLLLLRRGGVALSLDTQRRRLRAPVIVNVPPGCVHAFEFQRESEGLVVTFGIELAQQAAQGADGLAQLLATPQALHIDGAARRETDLDALATMLLREFSRAAPGREAALAGLLGALLANLQRLIHHQQLGRQAPPSRELELTARFRRLVEQCYREHHAIARYARRLGASETRLRRACLAAAGAAPLEILQRRLLIEAERQLRYTALSVRQIAWHLGYTDPAYFSRFFTRAAGLSPRAFRNRQRH